LSHDAIATYWYNVMRPYRELPHPPGLVNRSAKVTVLSLEQFQAEYNQQQWVSGDR